MLLNPCQPGVSRCGRTCSSPPLCLPVCVCVLLPLHHFPLPPVKSSSPLFSTAFLLLPLQQAATPPPPLSFSSLSSLFDLFTFSPPLPSHFIFQQPIKLLMWELIHYELITCKLARQSYFSYFFCHSYSLCGVHILMLSCKHYILILCVTVSIVSLGDPSRERDSRRLSSFTEQINVAACWDRLQITDHPVKTVADITFITP